MIEKHLNVLTTILNVQYIRGKTLQWSQWMMKLSSRWNLEYVVTKSNSLACYSTI